ncbi:MAG: type II secretion system GspH family protein [Proteobacteria bacterium]|nr:type II secretion system GspH family protein [Pseudomonadota bacterium]
MEEHVINQKKVRKGKFGNKGFTLIEILIVVMVLGILAMVIVPQITVSTQDAKESTLQSNLATLKNAIELYYVQHNNVYPGEHLDTTGVPTADMALAATAFVKQLTQFTGATGIAYLTKALAEAAGTAYGPYLKGELPANPYDNINVVTCAASGDITITTVVTTNGGWYYYPVIGKILPANAP